MARGGGRVVWQISLKSDSELRRGLEFIRYLDEARVNHSGTSTCSTRPVYNNLYLSRQVTATLSVN